MAYNPSIGKISQPVNIYDVQRCFGLSSPDLATLILNANINMWSDIKPMYSTKITQLTATDRANPRSITGYKTGGGIKKWSNTFANYQTGMGSYGNPASQIWSLDRPILDGSCAFRLTDFAGYAHFAQNVFTIYSYIKNLVNIPIPSTTGGAGGVNIDTMIYTNTISDCIPANALFGDVLSSFYPAIIMTCANFIPGTNPSVRCHYVKSTDYNLNHYLSNQDINATIRVNTADFAAAVATDMGGGNTPYQNAPLIDGTKWTLCVALVSRLFNGDTGVSEHRFNDSDTIVRLEYEANIDRWTLPIAQGKSTLISSMTMRVTLVRKTNLENNNRVYQIGSVTVTADKLTSDQLTFNVTANLSCHLGSVSVSGAQDPTNVNCGSVTFTGTGSQTQTVQIPTTTFTVTGTTSGNMECNGMLTLHNQNVGDFSGGFNKGVESGDSTYVMVEDLI